MTFPLYTAKLDVFARGILCALTLVSTIYEFVKEERDNRRTDTVEITDGYEVNQYETLNTIELYQLPLHDRQLRAPG